MRVLVTGGCGFIGSAVIRHLILTRGYRVLNIDAMTYAGTAGSLRVVSDDPRYSWLRADICDRSAVDRAITAFRPQRVMHLAAESHVDRSIAGAGEFVQTNVVGTFTMLEAARRFWTQLDSIDRAAFRFLQVSTDEVFGSQDDGGRFDEKTAYDPSSPYSATKAAGDHLARAWHRTYGLPVIVSACSNNYGPYHFPEKLIPLTIVRALAGQAIAVYGDGQQVRDWLHVEDHARALDVIAERGRPGETYTVGGHEERPNIAVVRRICAILDELTPDGAPHDRLIAHVVDRPGHDARYAIDSGKLESELGWRARESFDSGIVKTVRWYLDNRWWWEPLCDRYDGARMGLAASSGRA